MKASIPIHRSALCAVLAAVALSAPFSALAATAVITYTVGPSNGATLMSVNVQAGAVPVNVSTALNPLALSPATGNDEGPFTVSADAA